MLSCYVWENRKVKHVRNSIVKSGLHGEEFEALEVCGFSVLSCALGIIRCEEFEVLKVCSSEVALWGLVSQVKPPILIKV